RGIDEAEDNTVQTTLKTSAPYSHYRRNEIRMPPPRRQNAGIRAHHGRPARGTSLARTSIEVALRRNRSVHLRQPVAIRAFRRPRQVPAHVGPRCEPAAG